MNIDNIDIKNILMGKNVNDIKGIDYRISNKDGEPYILTADFCPDRINVDIENDIITNVWFG